MSRYGLSLLVALVCLTTTPLLAQDPAPQAPVTAQPGPRLEAGFPSYQATVAPQQESAATAAAEHISITASTLGLVLLIVLVIVLL